jgi:hypothetical protein
MNHHRDLQAKVESRNDALLINADRKATLAERTADEAERIADEIVRDLNRLHGFATRGDLRLDEVSCIGPDKSDSTIEREILRVIGLAFDDQSNPIHWVAQMVRDALTENVDVLQAAHTAAYSEMVDRTNDQWSES